MDLPDLLDHHHDVIDATISKAIARSRVNTADRDDLHAELWLYFLNSRRGIIRNFRGQSSLETYLFRIFIRAVWRWQRRRNLHYRIEVGLEEPATQRALYEMAGDKLRRSDVDDLHVLRQALSELPAKSRRLIRMRLEGRSFQEIAKSSGSPIRTVQTLVTRATRRLREAAGQTKQRR